MKRALNEAISQRRFKQVHFFINSGVNLNSKTCDGKTALIQLCELESEEKVLTLAKVLIQRGAKVGKTDDRGRNGLMCAILQKKDKLVSIFLEEMFNYDLNAKDHDGNTALTHAAATGNVKIVSDIVQGLKKFGLSVDVRNNEGMTPLMVASEAGHLSCAKIVLQEGKASKFILGKSALKSASGWEYSSLQSNLESQRTKSAVNQRQKSEENESTRQHLTSSTEKLTTTQKLEILQLFDVYKEQFSKAYRVGYRITKTDDESDNSCESLTDNNFKLGCNECEEKSTGRNQTRSLFTKGAAVVKFKKGTNSSCNFARKFSNATTLSASFPPGAPPRKGPSPGPKDGEKTKVCQTNNPELIKSAASRLIRRPIRSRSEILYSNDKSDKENAFHSRHSSGKLPRISFSETKMTVLEENKNY